MATDKHEELNRVQLKQISGLARTLHETAEELYNLTNRRHPEAQYANWLIKQAHKRIIEILKFLGEEL